MSRRFVTQWTISFLLGILVSYYGNVAVWLVSLLFLACWIFCFVKKRNYFYLLCLLFFVLGVGRQEGQQNIKEKVEQYLETNTDICVAGRIAKKEEKNNKVSYYLKDSIIICGKSYISSNQILVYRKADDYSIGDIIKVNGSARKFREARNEGNFEEKNYYSSKNILFSLDGEEVELLKEKKYNWQEFLYQLRRKMKNIFLKCLPAEEAGVLSVMVLGEKELLDPEIKALYQQSGISHLLAISGLHISIVGMGIYRFLRGRGISYLLAGGVAGILVIGFGQLSGMELSSKRAVMMFLIMLLGNYLGMAYDSVTALSVACFFQLWDVPASIWNVGFIFSYSAVLAVVVVVKIWKDFWSNCFKSEKKKGEAIWQKIVATLGDTMALNAGIQLVTLPISVYFYYEFPIYSMFINGLLIPFMGMALAFGLLGGIAGLFYEVLGGVLLKPSYIILKWNKFICEIFQEFPKSSWVTGQPKLSVMIFYYNVLSITLFVMYQIAKKEKDVGVISVKGEAKEEKKKTVKEKSRWLICMVPITMLMCLLFVRGRPESQICFLDVGQGDGIFFQTKEGATFFLDGGSTSEKSVGKYRMLSFLKYRGVDHVDGWFVSHADEDHVSGLLELWDEGYQIDTLFLSAGIVRDEAHAKLCEYATRNGTQIRYLNYNEKVGTKSTIFTCLYPIESGEERNASSMVLQVDMEGITGFFGGDIGIEQEKELLNTYSGHDVELYKALHHGSNSSNGKKILSQLSPGITVVSCAENNSYGHPGAEAIQNIEEAGSKIFYTMRSGQITLLCDGQKVRIKTFLEEAGQEHCEKETH